MNALDLRTIAHVLRGDVVGRQVMAPGPGHSPRDRSLSVRLSDDPSLGFIVTSHARDDWRTCRDYVAARLGFAPEPIIKPRRPAAVSPAPDVDNRDRARSLWKEAEEPRGTVVDRYLASRRLHLSDDIAGSVVRFHPACPWRDEAGNFVRVPAMVAAFRSIKGDELVAVHRTALTADGRKIGRKMLGPVAGAAIKIDADDEVCTGLTVGEGFETCLAARQLGFRTTWAPGSVNAVAAFPVLSGIEALTILEETDDTSERAVRDCATRWHAAGCEVLIVRPKIGKDINDAIMGARAQ